MATVLAALEQLVRPVAPVAIQATGRHHRMLATRHTQTWIQKYTSLVDRYRPRRPSSTSPLTLAAHQ